MSTRVSIWQDSAGDYHYQIYQPGVKGARKVPTTCGRAIDNLSERAWFDVGDRRGGVYYSGRVCPPCSAALVY